MTQTHLFLICYHRDKFAEVVGQMDRLANQAEFVVFPVPAVAQSPQRSDARREKRQTNSPASTPPQVNQSPSAGRSPVQPLSPKSPSVSIFSERDAMELTLAPGITLEDAVSRTATHSSLLECVEWAHYIAKCLRLEYVYTICASTVTLLLMHFYL